MKKELDDAQKLILQFLDKNDWWRNIWLRKIAEYAKLDHPQKALNKINQLEKLWYVRKNYEEGKYDVFKDNPVPEFVAVPMYSSEQFFHKGFEVGKTTPIKRVKVPSDILWLTNSEDYFFIKVKWKSLLPIIKPNDLVLIKQEKHLKEWRKYLVLHNKVLEKKVLHKIGRDLFLVSANFDFDKEQPLVVKKDVKVLWETKNAIIFL